VPKQEDHEERKRLIVEALFRVTVRDGLAAATYRTIATEAGIPPAQVQYYFGTKAVLIDAALFELGRRVVGRGMALMEAAGPDPPPERLLRAAVEGSHPVDDETRRDLVLFFIFFGTALTDVAMADSALIGSQRFIAGYFADLVREAQRRGEVDPAVEPDHEARLLLFANAGLILAALVGVHSIEDATATMDYLLARLFRPPGQ
jgi:AcrR family transcriptional regulator